MEFLDHVDALFLFLFLFFCFLATHSDTQDLLLCSEITLDLETTWDAGRLNCNPVHPRSALARQTSDCLRYCSSPTIHVFVRNICTVFYRGSMPAVNVNSFCTTASSDDFYFLPKCHIYFCEISHCFDCIT